MISDEKLMNIKVVELINMYNFYFDIFSFDQIYTVENFSINGNFKQDFETLNDFNNKSREHKSC